ncbi:hypothetical protein [Melioribacter sp. OK-6-Me]|uniref:hypothetical protein n=1 Tax=unclassified Melioribacter TaxID=2627329 RepID=UPI003EDA31D4
MAKKKNNAELHDFPLFCDYTCKYADFTNPEAIGACRKELAVWCKYFKRYNNKNNKCLARK